MAELAGQSSASLDALRMRGVPSLHGDRTGVDVEVLYRLPDALRTAQGVFTRGCLAEEFGVTLVGFLRARRCNVHAGADRLALPVKR